MSRFEFVASAAIPGSSDELRLLRRGDEFSIRVAGHGELMNSRTHGSEDVLGEVACSRLPGRPGASVLIGGLGMGFTLAAALAVLAPDARVTVAELVPEVVRWNQGLLGDSAGRPLEDARVDLVSCDVGALIGAGSSAYDAIVLDVDNGPEGLSRRANDALYSLDGLAQAQRALKPDGTLAVWSAAPDRLFVARLRKAGFEVEERRVRAHAGRGARHVIWLASSCSVRV